MILIVIFLIVMATFLWYSMCQISKRADIIIEGEFAKMENAMDIIHVTNANCEFCSKEYIYEESKKLANTPNDQNKAMAINRLLLSATKQNKPCVQFRCSSQLLGEDIFHYICTNHLYKMIDAIKDYEENSNE